MSFARNRAKVVGTKLTNQQRAAFAEMLHPHHEYLARFCRHLVGSDEDGRDLYQQAILKALVKLDTLNDPGRFRPWVCSIIVNEHRSHCRKERLRRWFSRSAQQETIDSGRTRTDPAVDPLNVARTVRLQWCLQRLSAKKREALVMFEVEGFTLAEIADIQRCSLEAAKTRVSRARRELRRLFVGSRPAIALCPPRREEGHALQISVKPVD